MFRQDLARPFERVMGCTPSELLGWLPGALPGARLDIESTPTSGSCRASFNVGQLLIEWRMLDSRQIALLKIPRINVRFTYSKMDIADRIDVQGYFDRATQRGGG
ncbi:MAG: hypothetical protein WCV99_04500 [Sterolibacterium sp.]|jgi:hypothetical protein